MNTIFNFLLLFFIHISYSQLFLDGVPFEFQLGGPVSYTPTSGGINIPGYILRIGYTKHQWIGVKFMTLTSNQNNDILIFKRSTTSNGGFYQCTVSEYYASSGRQDVLMSDTINNMDKQISTLSDSNHFYLQMFRTRGNTNGQDWQGGQFVQICFFTSDAIFNKDNWQAQYQTCYGFTVTNFASKWIGYEIISDSTIDGFPSKIYGGLSGSPLRFQFYVYRPSPTLSGNQVTIKIGDRINAQVGYDYQLCMTNKGDYFGNSTATMNKDLIYSGFNDNNCYVNTTVASFILYFSRVLNTHDDFDNLISSSTSFCFIIGSNQNCHILTPKNTFPQMTIKSALKLHQNNLVIGLFSLMILIFFLY